MSVQSVWGPTMYEETLTDWVRRHPSANVYTPGKQHTSRLAAERAYPKTGTNRCKVLGVITAYGGLTCDEVCEKLHMLVQSATPTINSLVKDGWLRDSGARRDTRTGNPAIVWEVCL